ncbi:hypothetical protein RhiirA1_442299 [Rhizophagus irregularis]|uniref:Uncharacterized protein n=1 Tax=Rhizophagus irregularis TaxID=588596 RepID=A0A2N0RQ51_9GLOM|nr:hypothetical protein RhiirA1_442299 [Rhizophagus irregularis]
MPKRSLPEEALKKYDIGIFGRNTIPNGGTRKHGINFSLKKYQISQEEIKANTRASQKELFLQNNLKNICTTPCAAGTGKKSIWPLHRCSVHILFFCESCTPRLMVELRPILAENPENPPSYDDEQSHKIENEEGPNSTVEESTFEPHIGILLCHIEKFLKKCGVIT